MKNIIVTGIPRSGTSLLTALIDSASNAVGLHEPDWQSEWVFYNKIYGPQFFAEYLAHDFSRIRHNLLNQKKVLDRRDDEGRSITNYYTRNIDGSVSLNYKVQPIKAKPLKADFTLAIKHCGLYLGALESIASSEKFSIVAIIRDKEKVLESWQTLPNIPPYRGRLPGAEVYCPKIRSIINQSINIYKKREQIYDYAYSKIINTKGVEVIYYENLIQSKSLESDTLRNLNINFALVK